MTRESQMKKYIQNNKNTYAIILEEERGDKSCYYLQKQYLQL